MAVGDFLVFGDNSDSQNLKKADKLPVGLIDRQVMILKERFAADTDGGLISAGDNVRQLNTETKNTLVGASFSAPRFTLPAGEFSIDIKSCAYLTFTTKLKLFDVTNGVFVASGLNAHSNGSTTTVRSDTSNPSLYHEMVLTSDTVFEVVHYAKQASTPHGRGFAVDDGVFPETYTEVLIEKIG